MNATHVEEFWFDDPRIDGRVKIYFGCHGAITSIEPGIDADDYFPGLKTTGYGSPPAWDIVFCYAPKVGDMMPEVQIWDEVLQHIFSDRRYVPATEFFREELEAHAAVVRRYDNQSQADQVGTLSPGGC